MFIEMKVAGIVMDSLTDTPILILKDLEEKKALPIWIGVLEASSIAAELENVKAPRPMTHDLIKNLLDSLEVKVTKIEVNDLQDNTFFASIYYTMSGKDFTIDSRPSDAISVALRTETPIFVEEKVIEKSHHTGEGNEERAKARMTKSETEKWEDILKNLSPEDFGKYKM